jgi:hypothetical protein
MRAPPEALVDLPERRMPIGKDAFATRRPETIRLEIEVLVDDRDTSVADEHWFSLIIETRSTVAVFRFNFKNSFRE